MVFIDVNEDSFMADDVITPLNPLIAPVEEEKFEETLLDVNVSQRLCDEEPFERMVHTQIDRLTCLLTHMF